MVSETYDEYLKLCSEVRRHNQLYFEKHEAEIDDLAYDALVHRLMKLEEKNPDWVSSSSPTQKVGEKTTQGFSQVPHKHPMLSLDKLFNQSELEQFDARIRKEIPSPVYFVEYKMDGCALSLIYEKGKFKQAITRGDGKKGDDVTENIKTLASLPLMLNLDSPPDYLEFRAEVYMTLDVFERLNKEREKEGLPPFANPRNASSGTLKLLDPAEVKRRQLSIAIYSVQEENEGKISSLEASWSFLKKQSLPIVESFRRCQSTKEIIQFIQESEELRPGLNYLIDGVVIKLNEYKDHKKLGSTGQYYRWGAAYKFSPVEAETTLQGISLQVGRTGVITPVAELNPVFIDGSLVSRASLHNKDEIERLGLSIGDRVKIVKSGDIIPKILSVTQKGESKTWQMPKNCPSCGSTLVHLEEEVALRCINPSCPDQLVKSLIYFCSKGAIDIEGMGEAIVEQLYHKGLIKDYVDIYTLEKSELLSLEGFKEKSAQNLIDSIEAKREIALPRFLVALGIPHIGSGLSELLADSLGTLERVQGASLIELMEIDGIGEKAANSLIHYFSVESNRERISRLLEEKVTILKQEVISHENHLFSGKTFVLTGTLESWTRSAAAAKIKERGGKVSSSVSKKTDYVLCGANTGSKEEKALKLGVTLIKEVEFNSLL